MGKPVFFLGLVAVLLCILFRTAFGDGGNDVKLDQIFLINPGTTHGGCDNHIDTLNAWHQEVINCLESATTALDAYDTDARVRAAAKAFFGIQDRGPASKGVQKTIKTIKQNFFFVSDLFSLGQDEDGNYVFPLKDDRYLFCGSDFLERQTPDTQAKDYEGDSMEKDNRPVTIADVPAYADALHADRNAVPWWSGTYSPVKGQFFSETGGDYCAATSLGLTSLIQTLQSGGANAMLIEMVILCPYSFTTSGRPDSFAAGSALIAENVNFATLVPKSATLLHEGFHVARGGGRGGFLEGDDEVYDLGKAINANQAVKLKNAESYTFFAVHMHYLFGEGTDGITKTADFGATQVGKKYLYAAKDVKVPKD